MLRRNMTSAECQISDPKGRYLVFTLLFFQMPMMKTQGLNTKIITKKPKSARNCESRAKFRTSSLDAGVHSITASYSGDETFLPSTSPELDQVIQAETRTKLRSSHNPSRPGQAVTFTTVVVANSGETPTGRITFSDFSTMLATVQLSGGQATLTTSRLRKGHHVIRADYGGSSTDERSSTTFQQRVK